MEFLREHDTRALRLDLLNALIDGLDAWGVPYVIR